MMRKILTIHLLCLYFGMGIISSEAVFSSDKPDSTRTRKKMKTSTEERKNLEMSTQIERAKSFSRLHVKDNPLILCNIWDAGTARAVGKSGAKAIATSSWAVAAAQGMEDGENLPFGLALANLERIIASVDLPVTIDLEAGYGTTPAEVAEKVTQVVKAGAIGINFEDQIIGGEGLYTIADQCARLQAVRKAADDLSIPLFVNARTDLFFKADPAQHNSDLIRQALERSSAYAKAGADGFFAPGLSDSVLIRELCEKSSLPVNIMLMGDTYPVSEMKKLGVSRISFGPDPYIKLMENLTKLGHKALSQ